LEKERKCRDAEEDFILLFVSGMLGKRFGERVEKERSSESKFLVL
jgi:hypothetical protein